MEQDPVKKEEKKTKLMRETIPFYLSKFEKHMAENNGFSVGSEVFILNYPTKSRYLNKSWICYGKSSNSEYMPIFQI